MSLSRPKLGVGSKTLLAFSIVFWLPVSIMAVLLFFLIQTQLQNDARGHIKFQLKVASEVYAERSLRLEGRLSQLVQNEQIQRLFSEKKSHALREVLQDIGKGNDFATVVVAVDANRQVISRRNNNKGDILNINNVLTDALSTGEIKHSTELVSHDFLAIENPEFENLFKDAELMQFVVAPVGDAGKIRGAIVVGVLLSDEPWLGNTVYNRFGVDMALFAGNSPEIFFLHSTSSVPRNIWKLRQPLPGFLQEQISHGKPYYGPLQISGVDTIAAFEPLKDSRNSVIGAIGVSKEAAGINGQALSLITKATLVAALLGLLVAIVLSLMVHHDISKPLNLLIEVMERFGNGDLSAQANLNTGDQLEKLGDGFNVMAKGIRSREERLNKQNRITKLLMSTLDMQELMEQTLHLVLEITNSHMGVVYLYEKEGDGLVSHARMGIDGDLKSLKLGEGLPGRAAKRGKILILDKDELKYMKMELGFGQVTPNEAAYIPLSYQDRILGVLVLGSLQYYGESERQLFDFMADQIAIAMDNAIMHQRVHEISVTDSLTGLYNRRMLNIRLEEEWAASLRHERPISILLADADNFKSINDQYGHEKGDEVLCAIADIFRANMRKEDVVARYGGEEFVAVLNETDSAQAQKLAERIGEIIRSYYFSWKDGAVTLSIGVATYPDIKAENAEALVQLADKAMYKAKASGKDKVVVADNRLLEKGD